MARAEIGEVVLSRSGRPVASASVQVNRRGAGTATVYSAETGSTTISNPLTTDSYGRIEGWLAEGSYDLVVTANGASYTQRFESKKGGAAGAGILSVTDSAYGAAGDGTTDDTAALTAAFAAAAGAGVVYLPPGTYKITSAITVPPGVSVLGAGVNAIIKAFSCDALTFPISTYIGGVSVSNFQILGSSASGDFSAIRVPGTAVAGGTARTTGITFDTLMINNFGYGFRLRGLWRSTIRRCNLFNVYYGIYSVGQNVLLDIHGNNVEKNTPPGTPSGAVNSMGCYVDSAFDYDPGGITEGRPENLRVHHNQFFGFDLGIYNKRCLVATYDQNDCDYAAVAAFRYNQSDSALTVTNNWLAVDGAGALYGIHGEAVGVGVSKGPAVFEGNMVSVIATSNASSAGIYLDDKQNYARIRDNYISGFKTADIKLISNNTDFLITGNVCTSSVPTNSIDIGTPCTGFLDKNTIAKAYTVNTGSRSGVATGLFTGAGATAAMTGPHRAHANRTTNQSINNNSQTAVNLDAERYDNNEFHDNVTNNTRLTFKMAGTYRMTGEAVWAASAAGSNRVAKLILNNATEMGVVTMPPAAIVLNQVVTTTWEVAANDYVELQVYQDSGGGLNITLAELMAERLT